jgi:plasmid stabilization system protein ParE
MKFEFHPEALSEYEAAIGYYGEREAGLDLRFVLAVEDAIRAILADPVHWPVFEDDVRRKLTRVFPYGILYTIEGESILLVAIMHCSREPDYWKQRLR